MRYVYLLIPALALAVPGTARAQFAEEVDAKPAEAPKDSPPAAPEPKSSFNPDDDPTARPDGRSPIDGVVGHFGFGYFTGDAPLGVRYWLDRDTAIDVGLDIAISSGDSTNMRYGAEAGYVLALGHYHYSVVFTRLGLGFNTISSNVDGVGREFNLNANAFLGAELFLGAFGFPNVSLQGGYGLEFDYFNEGGSNFTLSAVDGGLNVVGAGEVGFHIYW